MTTKLRNTTVKLNKKENTYSVYKGKGSGSQIAMFKTIEECEKFDLYFCNLEYKNIFQKSTNKKGGAYFYIGTEKIFDDKHPFAHDFRF